MKITNTSITLEKLRFYSYHGLLEHEKRVGNNFEVTLIIHFPASDVMVSGNLSKGINYAEVYQFLQQEMAYPTELLEVLTYRILDRLKCAFPLISQAIFSVTKVAPPIEGFDGAGVTFSASADYEAK